MRKRSPRNRQLSMVQAAEMFGIAVPGTDEPMARKIALTKIVRKLRAAQRSTGLNVLFGGGAGGLRYWTTVGALRKAGLVDDLTEIADEAREVFEELNDRLDGIDERVSKIASAVSKMLAEHADLKSRVARIVGHRVG